MARKARAPRDAPTPDGASTGTRPLAAADGSATAVGQSTGVGQRPAPHRGLTPRQWLGLGLLATVMVVIGGGVGYASSLVVREQYAARAEVHYNLAEAKPNELLREDRTLSTQLVVLRSRTVLEPAAVIHGLTTEALADKVTAVVVEGSEIIEVEVRDRSPERALRLLETIVTRYLALTNTPTEDPARSYVESELRAVRDSLANPGLRLAQAEVLAQREAALLAELDSIELAQRAPAEVLTPPYSVSDPVSPRPLFTTATGALTALLLAVAAVALLARRWVRRSAAGTGPAAAHGFGAATGPPVAGHQADRKRPGVVGVPPSSAASASGPTRQPASPPSGPVARPSGEGRSAPP